MERHEKIDYVEFAAADLEATKTFFNTVFGWNFTDYGPEYCDCFDGGLMIGFYKAELTSRHETGGALVTFYSADLEATQVKIEAAGGTVVKPIIHFPGGCRFQFTEPSGNEFGVWSDQGLPDTAGS